MKKPGDSAERRKPSGAASKAGKRRGLIIILADQLAGLRIDQVNPCAGVAGHGLE